ncbi:MAG: hypothetical protein LBI54_03800 [Lachnospiraceae bacterium]|jgi:hypothetical protein|nr:hypothetical protein [Lachnospiraceae bacterium]
MIDDFFHILDYWMYLRRGQCSVAGYFSDHGFRTVAIHGMGSMACHLLDDLRDSPIKVAYVIEKSHRSYCQDIPVFTMNDALPAVDAIVVTATTKFAEIKEELTEKAKCPIIALDEVVFYNYII